MLRFFEVSAVAVMKKHYVLLEPCPNGSLENRMGVLCKYNLMILSDLS